MATFRVGQRVRYVRKHSSVQSMGTTTIPLGSTGVLKASQVPWKADFYMLFDDYKSAHPDGCFLMNSDMIEPIQPERNQTIEWSECLWQPEHQRESA